MLGVAMASIVAWALFSDGATSLENEAGLQIALCAAALVTLAGLLFSPRVRLRAPAIALVGVGLLVLFAAWSGWSIAWSIAPDLSWVQLNRWAAYALVAALALVLGASLRRAPQLTALAFLVVATAVAAYALGGKVIPWFSIPGLIDLDHTADFSRLREPLGYWNALGLVCVLAGPIAVRTAADPDASPRWRTFSLVSLVVLLVTLGLTYSRGGILSLLVALAVLVAIGPDRLRLAAYAVLGIVAAVPAYLVAVVRDDLTTDGVVQAERADDGLILLAALLAAIALAVWAGRWLRERDAHLGRALALPSVRPRNALIVAGAALFVLIGGLAVSERGVTGTIEDRWDDFTTVKSDDQSDPSRVLRSNSGNRWVWWKEAAGAFSDEPVKGWGAGSFPLVHRRYRENDLPVRQAHSVPLQFLAETGLVGALLALGGLGLLGWAAAGRLRLAEGREHRYVAALACASLAWGVHMWFDWDSDIPGVTVPLLIFLGVLAARPPGTADAVDAVPPQDDVRAPAGPRLAGLLAGALILAALATSAYLPWLADDKAAEATLLGAVSDEGTLADAAKRADEAMQLNPLSIDPVAAAIAIAQKRGRFEEAAELVEDAVDRQPENPDVWLRAYGVQQFLDDAPARIASMRRLFELDPHEDRLPLHGVAGDAAVRSASATGTPLVVEVLPATPPPVGPPAPDARPLIGPPRSASAGGDSVEPPTGETSESAPVRP